MESTIDELLKGGIQQEEKAAPAAVETPKPAVEEAKPPVEGVEDPQDEFAPDDDLDAAQEDAAKPNLLDLKQPRGKRIYQSYKAYKQIAEAVGQELTPESAKQHFESHADKLAMEAEFTSGDPAQVGNWLGYWNSVSPQAMNSAAAQMPDLLAQHNPQAYQAMAVPVLTRYIHALYNRAQQEADPERQKAMLYTAQMADWDLFGSFKKADELKAAPGPLDEREAQVQQGLKRIEDFNKEQQNARSREWYSGVQKANNSVLEADVDKALAPLKPTLAGRVYSAAKRDFIEAVEQHLNKDVDGQRIFNLQVSRTQMTQQGQEAITAAFTQRASRAVRALAPGFLKEAGIAAQARSEERHTALASAQAAGTAPAGAGVPVKQSIANVPQKQYASKGEQMDATIDDLFGVKR